MATTNGCGRWGRTSSTDDEHSVLIGLIARQDDAAERMPRAVIWRGTKRANAGLLSRSGNPAAIRSWFNTNSQAVSFIRAHIAKGTIVRAGEAACWDKPYERFEVTRINHQAAYDLDGARVDMAEEYVSRLRGAKTGIQPTGAYWLRYQPWNAASIEAGENPRISAPIGNVIISRRGDRSTASRTIDVYQFIKP